MTTWYFWFTVQIIGCISCNIISPQMPIDVGTFIKCEIAEKKLIEKWGDSSSGTQYAIVKTICFASEMIQQ